MTWCAALCDGKEDEDVVEDGHWICEHDQFDVGRYLRLVVPAHPWNGKTTTYIECTPPSTVPRA